jgi:hypothetical protein
MAVPTDVADLGLWFDAADFVGLANNDPIGGTSTWVSKVGTSVGSQATSGLRPTKQTVGGAPAVLFVASRVDQLDLSADALTVTQNKPGVTIFAKVRAVSFPVGNQGYIIQLDRNVLDSSRSSVGATPAGAAHARGRRDDADVAVQVLGGTVGTTNNRVITGVFDYTNNDLLTYLDGTLVNSNVDTWSAGGNSSNTASAGARIGSDGGTQTFDGYVFEICVYSRALNTSERESIEQYLMGTQIPPPVLESGPVAAVITGLRLG